MNFKYEVALSFAGVVKVSSLIHFLLSAIDDGVEQCSVAICLSCE